MHIVFLGARLPLTKSFVAQDGRIVATPYPHVTRVTSYHEEASNLADFHALLTKHAVKGRCLFGGALQHPLVDESRAGKTLRNARDWVVFDFDKVEGKTHEEVVRRYLPAECQNVSYIAQLSASMWRPDASKWSGHIFMQLKTPCEETYLKQWVEAINFSNKDLHSQVTLSDSMHALHWPLDRTAVYNSKLIYIAPPKCHGFEPSVKQPIVLVKKKQPTLAITPFAPIDSVTIRQKINELRRAVGESDIDYTTSLHEGHEVLLKSGICEIHGLRTSGDHYIRFNLNGGDSFAYFIDLRNPGLIKNFKGEPFLKTEETAPDLWKSLRAKAPTIVAKQPLEEGTDVLAFYATNQNSQIKIGQFSPVSRRLVLNSSSETAARAWLSEWGLVQKSFLPHMELVFEPKNDLQYLHGSTRINLFQATKYMTRERTSTKPSSILELPTVINKLLRSMLGEPTPETLAHFINWLAFVYQYREKTETAWVVHGRTGTGKGSFVKYVLTPLFGPEHVAVVQFGLLAGQFNGFLENKLFVVFEEADTKAVDNSAELLAKLNHYITDSPIEIRKMRTDSYRADNFANFFFFSNQRTPVILTHDDRRFNVADRQEQQLILTPNEWLKLNGGEELDAFADVLQRWPVSEAAVRRPIETKAKQDIHEASTSVNQLIAEAVQKGDLQFFIDRIPSDAEAASDFSNGRFNPIGLYRALVDSYAEAATKDKPVAVRDEDLFILFRTLIPDTRYFQDSKTWRKRHYKTLGLEVDKRVRVPGDADQRVYGMLVKWTHDGSHKPVQSSANTNVTPIKGKKK